MPPARDSYGRQLDEEGNPEDSIPRAKAKTGSVEDAWERLARKITGGSPLGKRIYLDRNQCKKLGVPYQNDGEVLVAAADAIIRSKNPWEGYDEYHLDLLEPLGGRTVEAVGDGYGWFKIRRVR